MKVIVIYADSLRRDHLGAYGNRWIQTPNLDRLASQASVFEHAYIGSFPTIPTRRDLFLGHGDIGAPFNRWKPFEPGEVTLAERLGEARVPTMMITDVQNSVTRGINMNKGFRAWHCNRGQEADPCWLDDRVPLAFPVEPHLIRYPAEWWHQILMTRAHRQTETDWFAPGTYAAAIRWLEQNYTRQDFFLYVDTFDPHEPWDPPKWYENLYDPGFRGRRFDAPTYGLVKKLGLTKREVKNIRARYAGEVTMVDTALGRLMTALEHLNLLDETLLVFTSDHGTCFDFPGDNGMICKANMLGDDGMIMAGGEAAREPLRYYPHWTGVCRIPLLVRLPGQTSGQRVRGIVQPWDLAPTVLDAFGAPKPDELWGESLLPLIRGERKPHRSVAVLGNNVHAQVMTREWMYAVWRGQRPPCLYNLKTDPDQKRNVIAKHPEVVARLHRHVIKHLERQGLEGLSEEYG